MSAGQATPSELDLRTKIREALRKSGIKLWEAPYTDPVSGSSTPEVNKLSQTLAREFTDNPVYEICAQIEFLRAFSFHRFQEKNAATRNLRVKLRIVLETGQKSDYDTVLEVTSTTTGADFAARIKPTLGKSLATSKIKIVFNGRVLDDKTTVSNLFHGFDEVSLLVLCSQPLDENSPAELVQRAIRAAEQMADRDTTRGTSLNMALEDQDGRPIELPPAQNKILVVAMALHEKGRAALKRNELLTALAFLLEADHAFAQLEAVNHALMRCIDNHALLQLDIVWVYFQLKEISSLTDAERRLQQCRTFLEQVHGNQLERLAAIRTSTPPELAIYARLNLMQGVLAYHSGWLEICEEKLRAARNLMQSVAVDSSKLVQLAHMGFSDKDARFGLRSCDGDVDRACDMLMQRRTQQEQRNREWQKQRNWGRTENGSKVDANNVEFLKGAGLEEHIAVRALKLADNAIEQALQIIDSQPERLVQATNSDTHKRKKRARTETNRKDDTHTHTTTSHAASVDPERIEELVQMGFPREWVQLALIRTGNNLESAVQLLTDPAISFDDANQSSAAATSSQQQQQHTSGNNNDFDSSNNDHNDNNDNNDKMDSTNDNNSATDRNTDADSLPSYTNEFDDIDAEGTDYLDLDLSAESEILSEYEMLCALSRQ